MPQNASQEYRANLRMLLEYLNAAGLIQRDGDMVKKGGASVAPAATQASPSENDNVQTGDSECRR